MLREKSSKGFTLIELLIVIVIIGILAGVLISVIDPATQQNRARDANTRAALIKLALATSSYVSAYGTIPDETQFADSNIVGFVDGNCSNAGDADCYFATGTPLPDSCTDNWKGHDATPSTATQCQFYYCGGKGTGYVSGTGCADSAEVHYRLFAKAFGTSSLFMYNSGDSKMYQCAAAGTGCVPL